MKTPIRLCGKCGNTLSQYNPETVCAPCFRISSAPRVPDRAWRDDQVQRALAAWEFGELLRLLRRRSGLSQMSVQALTGLTQSYISDLENGRKQLGSRDAIIDLLNGLGLPMDLRSLLLTPFAGKDQMTDPETLDPGPWTTSCGH